jgi:nucleotide-binding universal stress UspA family protein
LPDLNQQVDRTAHSLLFYQQASARSGGSAGDSRFSGADAEFETPVEGVTMKILLAIDGSTFSDAAVKEVAEKPWPSGSEVKIISVVEPPLLPTIETWVPPENYIEALEAASEEQAQSILNKAAERVRKGQNGNLRISTQIVMGHPKHAIIDEADSWGADLILLGSHGYRGLTRLWLGSVSQAVAAHAKCSVGIVRKREQSAEKGA